MSTLHDCPCGCGDRIARNMLACRTGWFALPLELAREITGALRRKDFRAHRAAVGDALRWYRANADELAEKRRVDRERA